MKTVATNKKLRELLTGIDSGSLIPRPDFQRRLVWTNKEKVSFIRTVLGGYPFPEIYVAAGEVNEETGAATEYLVDGQQRITTLYHYFKGHDTIKLPNDISTYADLETDEKKDFLQYDVVVRDLGNLEIEEIKEIFQRINSTSYSLNAMELDNSRFAGAYKEFGEKIAEMDFFETRKFFSPNDVRRMHDLRYVLVLVSTMLSGYFNDSSKVEEFLANYNDSFDKKEEIEDRIQKAMQFIESCGFSDKSRVWNKADLFTLMVELDKAYFSKGEAPKVSPIRKGLKAFYRSMEGNIEPDKLDEDTAKYYKAAIQGSNSRSRRITRGEILRGILS